MMLFGISAMPKVNLKTVLKFFFFVAKIGIIVDINAPFCCCLNISDEDDLVCPFKRNLAFL